MVPGIADLFKERISADAHDAFSEVCEVAGLRDAGGYFCLYRRDIGRAVWFERFGFVANRLARRERSKCCLEMVSRLDILLDSGIQHCSSYESRNHAKGRYGGAFYASKSPSTVKYIAAFAGLSEEHSEAVALRTLVRLQMVRETDAIVMARVTDNQFYLERATFKMWKKCNNGFGTAISLAGIGSSGEFTFNCCRPGCGNHTLWAGPDDAVAGNRIPIRLPCMDMEVLFT